MITEGSDGWISARPDDQLCLAWVRDQQLAWYLDSALRKQQKVESNQLARVDSFQHPEATSIRPRWAGEPFDLHACVQALFAMKLPEPRTDNLDRQAA